ncbi:MAG: sel1 repeat family protein [Clostridia bacterium]|nr:sel1 repeat family protein [Clostridia bacterium]
MKISKESVQLDKQATQLLKDGKKKQAFELFKKASEMGNFVSTYNVACMYYFGDGVEANHSTALEWFKKASDQGDREAENRVGVMYEEGIGTDIDLNQAFLRYKNSAEAGSLGGMGNLAKCYLYGIGTSVDVEEGLRWMETASKKGNGIATLELGNIYCDGKFVPKDYAMARKILERGLMQKYGPALEKLADLLENGLGGEVDIKRAEYLRRIAPDIFVDDD